MIWAQCLQLSLGSTEVTVTKDALSPSIMASTISTTMIHQRLWLTATGQSYLILYLPVSQVLQWHSLSNLMPNCCLDKSHISKRVTSTTTTTSTRGPRRRYQNVENYQVNWTKILPKILMMTILKAPGNNCYCKVTITYMK